MPERVAYHFRLSTALTLTSIALTEVVHHLLGIDDTLSAGVFLLGLVPIAYGALGAGFLAGVMNTALLALYVMHYSGPHGELASWSEWSSGLVVLALGLAMSYPMSVIHAREVRFRREIRDRTTALQRRNEELTELNAALESFGYVVSHDLKEPVRAIENYLAGAQEEWGSEESRRFVAEAHDANRRLARMLQGLLEYSRASSLTVTTQPMDVARIVEGEACRAMYERAFRERGTTLAIEPDLPAVRGEEILLTQIFGNLLLNAARHHPSGKGLVRIARGDARPGRAHIVVADDGAGYPPEVLERFSRMPSRGSATVRGGFGLVIAQRAARKLEGHLWLENANDGARAHLELPAA